MSRNLAESEIIVIIIIMTAKKVIVVGAGASGLMAAGTAAEHDADVILIEKMNKAGRKLLLTGNHRCNFTNTEALPEFLKKFSCNRGFIKPAVYAFSSKSLIVFFKKLGVNAKVENGNRIFPASDSSAEVLKALTDWLELNNINMVLETPVKRLIAENGSVTAVEDSYGVKHYADSVIIATGGMSYPLTGSTGDGYRWAQKLGHSVIKPRPSIVPVETCQNITEQLKGVSLRSVSVRVYLPGKKRKAEVGDVLFTHFGLSGPAILTLSRFIVDSIDAGDKPVISIDIRPDMRDNELEQCLLDEIKKGARKKLKSIIRSLLKKKLAQACLKLNGLNGDKSGNQVTSEDRKKIRLWIKDFRIPVTGYRPIEESIITAGGVSTLEINRSNMGSKIIKNLFFAGEVIDIDAVTGGYNLQAAFSTGYLAGKSAASKD